MVQESVEYGGGENFVPGELTIFLHADPCQRYADTDQIPAMYLERERYLLKGYDRSDRIIYGTGRFVRSA